MWTIWVGVAITHLEVGHSLRMVTQQVQIPDVRPVASFPGWVGLRLRHIAPTYRHRTLESALYGKGLSGYSPPLRFCSGVRWENLCHIIRRAPGVVAQCASQTSAEVPAAQRRTPSRSSADSAECGATPVALWDRPEPYNHESRYRVRTTAGAHARGCPGRPLCPAILREQSRSTQPKGGTHRTMECSPPL